MAALAVGVLLAAFAVWFVLQPIFRPERATGLAEGTATAEDPDDDLSPQAVALRALREIEFDRATGKLSDVDYDDLRREYTAAALAARRAETGTGAAGAPGPPPPLPPQPSPAHRAPRPACATHGPRPEPGAEFCSICGRRLASAPGFCAGCGTALEADARYCHACGTRVAA